MAQVREHGIERLIGNLEAVNALKQQMEVNPGSDRGFLFEADLPASDATWLTLNDINVAQGILNCAVNNQELCRKSRAFISTRTGGFVHSVGEWGELPESSYHVLYADLRSKTFLYSVLTDQKAEYYLSS